MKQLQMDYKSYIKSWDLNNNGTIEVTYFKIYSAHDNGSKWEEVKNIVEDSFPIRINFYLKILHERHNI